MSIIQKLLDEKCGFVTDADMPEVIKENRLQQVLVRCGLAGSSARPRTPSIS
jgi:hypothetical protein